jgi:hypothetical protein
MRCCKTSGNICRPNTQLGAISYLKDTAQSAIREWERIAHLLEELDPPPPASGLSTRPPNPPHAARRDMTC